MAKRQDKEAVCTLNIPGATVSIPLKETSTEISIPERRVSILTLEYWKDPKVLRLIVLAFGLVFFFIIYGILQERIMTIKYGDEEFKNSAYLVFNNRLIAIIAAIFMLKYKGEDMSPTAPIYKYAGVSLSNIIATWCQYESLKFVSFPTQTLGKCGKMIPVMILGTLISGKKYGWKDYLSVFMITVGVGVFILTGKVSQKESNDDTFYGLGLIGGYLFVDGFTSTLQEILFKDYRMSTYNQMLYVNSVSMILSLVPLLIQQQFFECVQFSIDHPDFLMHSLGLSVCAVLGQIMIYTTIREFGALIFSALMTTRQFLNILLSCIIYLHPLTAGQWAGVILVFGVLYYTADNKKSHRPQPKKQETPDGSTQTEKS